MIPLINRATKPMAPSTTEAKPAMIPATVTYLDGVPKSGPDGQTITTWNSGIYDGIYLITLAISILLSHSLQGFRMVSESYEYISAGSSWCKIFSITSMCINPIPIVARWGRDVCDQTDPVWLLWQVLRAKMRIELNDWKKKIYIYNIYKYIYIYIIYYIYNIFIYT